MRSRASLFTILGVATSVTLVGVLLTAGTPAEEFDELTPAAAAAVKALFPEATVMGVGQEREQGVLYYEVVVSNAGGRVEVEVTADGSIGEIESVVSITDVPEAAREQILSNTRGTKITRVERHEVRGVPQDGTFVPADPPVVLYEVGYDDNGRRKEFVVSEDGSRSPFGEEDDDDNGSDEDDDD
jgi:hypothetical protein